VIAGLKLASTEPHRREASSMAFLRHAHQGPDRSCHSGCSNINSPSDVAVSQPLFW